MNEITTSGRAANPFHRNRAILFSLFALVLVVLSFHGVLDNVASSKIDELTKRSLGLLVVSKGINTIVSILQTIEFTIPFISSAQIGQALDPINDGAERLTGALIWATGSLFLQNILIKITSGTIVKWGFFAIASIAVTTLLLAQSNRVRIAFATSLGVSHVTLAQLQGILIKTFIVATIVRFIVPTFAIASLLVSQALVAPEIEQHARELERQERSLSEMGALISEARDEVIKEQTSQDAIPAEDETEDPPSDVETEQTPAPSAQPAFRGAEGLQVLAEQKVQLEETLALLESDRERLSNRISELKNTGWKAWIAKFADSPDEALTEANARLARMRHRFRISMHLSCEPHGFRRSGRRLRVDWRDWLSLWRCGGWWWTSSGSHLYGIFGLRACGGLGVAPIRGCGGWRSPSGYPDGFHNGAFCKFASTSVKVLAYGYACENDSHIRRAVILTRAPIFNSFSRSVAHWARANCVPSAPSLRSACIST